MVVVDGASLILDLENLSPACLQQAAEHFSKAGFILLDGVRDCVSRPLSDSVAGALGADENEMAALLEPLTEEWAFSLESRQKLSRVGTSPDLQSQLVDSLRPVLASLLGPFAHVSSSFHAQFKAASAMQHTVDHGGYEQQNEHMELHGAYLLHQDFAGAAIPTSPGGLTLWAGLNDCPDWPLRLYPGSHRRGLICDSWLANDDERVVQLGPPVDIQARRGQAILFHAMLVHGSCNAGPRRRVSCDIRFFPLCGFLPTQPVFLHEHPCQALATQLETNPPDTIRASLQESQVFLGQKPELTAAEPLSVMNWVQVVEALARNDKASAFEHLRQFVNHEIGTGTVEDYSDRMLNCPINGAMLKQLSERLAQAEPQGEYSNQLSRFADLHMPASKEADVANARP